MKINLDNAAQGDEFTDHIGNLWCYDEPYIYQHRAAHLLSMTVKRGKYVRVFNFDGVCLNGPYMLVHAAGELPPPQSGAEIELIAAWRAVEAAERGTLLSRLRTVHTRARLFRAVAGMVRDIEGRTNAV